MENDNHIVDEVIARIKYNETAQKFLSRTRLEPISTMVSFLDRQDLFPGQTVEVSGCSSSAKTELLIQVFQLRFLHGWRIRLVSLDSTVYDSICHQRLIAWLPK